MINRNTLIIIAVFSISWNLHAQWVTVDIPTRENLNSISMLSESLGLIVGDKGTILQKSHDTWIILQGVTDENLYSVCYSGENTAWAVGGNGVILFFNGKDWTNIESPTRARLYSVSFSDSETGYITGAHGTVLKYENGRWSPVHKATRGNLYSVATKGNTVIIGGGLECLSVPLLKFSSTNNRKLEKVFTPDFIEVKGLAIANQRSLWAVGSPSSILHFNGNDWKTVDQYSNIPSLNAIYFSDENHGIAVGYSGTIMTCLMEDWTVETSPVNVKLNSACITGSMYYAVGNEGTLISIKRTFVPNDNRGKTTKQILASFPNPSSDVLNIKIPEGEWNTSGSVTVMNTYGQVIIRKDLTGLNGGQEFQISTTDLSNGLYLVQFTSSTTSALCKFVVKH